MRIPYDIHVHTHYSSCCHDKSNTTAAKCVEEAAVLGLEVIGFSDHIWDNPDIAPSPWYLPQDKSHIRLLREELALVSSSLKTLVGCEGETISPGRFGVTKGFAEQLDFVLLSCSHFHMDGFVEPPLDKTPRGVAQHLINFFLSGVESGLATSIAHPFLPLGFLEHYDAIIAAIEDHELLDVCGAAAEQGVALEITASFLPSPRKCLSLWSVETPLRFLKLAERAGCYFTLGSDAHAPAEMRLIHQLDCFLRELDPARIKDMRGK